MNISDIEYKVAQSVDLSRLVLHDAPQMTTGDPRMDEILELSIDEAVKRSLPHIKEMLKQEIVRRFNITPEI